MIWKIWKKKFLKLKSFSVPSFGSDYKEVNFSWVNRLFFSNSRAIDLFGCEKLRFFEKLIFYEFLEFLELHSSLSFHNISSLKKDLFLVRPNHIKIYCWIRYPNVLKKNSKFSDFYHNSASFLNLLSAEVT